MSSWGYGEDIIDNGQSIASVRRKDFWLLSTGSRLLTDFIPKLSHEVESLILQGWDDTYVPRTRQGLLKWKYVSMNSVDFLFEVSRSSVDATSTWDQLEKLISTSNNHVVLLFFTLKLI